MQLRYDLNENPANLEGEVCWRQKIAYATEADIPEWMELVHLVIDGFPHLDEEQYLEQLREYIRNRRASCFSRRGMAACISGSLSWIFPYRQEAVRMVFQKW